MADRTVPERERDEGVWVSVDTEDTVLAAVESAAQEVYDVLGSGLVESYDVCGIIIVAILQHLRH